MICRWRFYISSHSRSDLVHTNCFATQPAVGINNCQREFVLWVRVIFLYIRRAWLAFVRHKQLPSNQAIDNSKNPLAEQNTMSNSPDSSKYHLPSESSPSKTPSLKSKLAASFKFSKSSKVAENLNPSSITLVAEEPKRELKSFPLWEFTCWQVKIPASTEAIDYRMVAAYNALNNAPKTGSSSKSGKGRGL